MATPMRGMGNIHTMAGRADGPVKPHKAYLRISCLEMEKARLGTERAAAQKRIDRINIRIKEMEVEKKTILDTLPPGEPRAGGTLLRNQAQAEAVSPKGKRGKAFRY